MPSSITELADLQIPVEEQPISFGSTFIKQVSILDQSSSNVKSETPISYRSILFDHVSFHDQSSFNVKSLADFKSCRNMSSLTGPLSISDAVHQNMSTISYVSFGDPCHSVHYRNRLMLPIVTMECAHLRIPLEDIIKAINNFSDENIIGKGDFGNVYKGKLMRSGELIKIFARRLDRKNRQGVVEFWTEISVLSSLKHENIVSMIGYCDEKDEKIIVIKQERKDKGSLWMHSTKPTLKWIQRVNISLGIASAIHHIHDTEERGCYIIHRNINSSTILLDANWKPMLSGFEFCIKRSIDQKDQDVRCEAIGTKGYMDPAIRKKGGVTHKSDIYSLGAILFEMLCGRRAYEDDTLLIPLATSHYENGTLKDIIDPDLWNQMDPYSFNLLSDLAYSCLKDDVAQRPDAEKVMINLKKALIYQSIHESVDQVTVEEEVGDAVESRSSVPWKVKSFEHLRIRLQDIQLATNNLSKKSEYWYDQFGVNYKAKLECFDREYHSFVKTKNIDELPKKQYTVQIKCIQNRGYHFKSEIEILSSCKHPNIASLLGFCDEGPDMILVYEFVSIDQYLSDYLRRGILTWKRRLKICIDVAHGLNYLHNEMEDQKAVIHRDINSSNIQLDYNYRAKIVGFGLSVFLPPIQDADGLHLNENESDKYCVDREHSKLNRESDVFSFGELMIEILCGMSADDVIAKEGGKDEGLAHWARLWLDQGILREKIAHVLEREIKYFLHKGPNKNSLDTFINIAYQCLGKIENERSTMKVIIEELEKALSFQENHRDTFSMSIEDIHLAIQTCSPDNVLGGGGFGRVYKGELTRGHVNGNKFIAAKKLDTSHGQGEKQFYTELQILHEYKHENIISLVGYSNETSEKIIVYEYASKGSLDKMLKDTTLRWKDRLKISIDVATGLDFLHGGSGGRKVVVHRDIKSSNILVFDDLKGKVGDFGLSIISGTCKETNFINDIICGTAGYVDPYYLMNHHVTIKSDIYSFGVVLFEILCGRETHITSKYEKGAVFFESLRRRETHTISKHEKESLLNFIKRNFEEGNQDAIVFEAIKEEIKPESLTTFLNIIYKCLHDDIKERPTSKEVVAQLLELHDA